MQAYEVRIKEYECSIRDYYCQESENEDWN